MDESDHESASRSETEASDVAGAIRATVYAVWRFSVDWVERRSRLTQLFLGAGVTTAYEALIPIVDGIGTVWTAAVGALSPTGALLILIGVQISQAVVQSQKLETVSARIGNMDEVTVTDGGREADADWRTGGGALGGAIAGVGVGASFGSTGVVAGILFGAIFGDMFEEWIGKPNEPTRSHSDHADLEDR